jgi:hypothetical protein
LLIRSQLKLKDEKLQTDAGLARALLLASDHQHGARSLEKLVVPLNVKTGEPLRRGEGIGREGTRMRRNRARTYCRRIWSATSSGLSRPSITADRSSVTGTAGDGTSFGTSFYGKRPNKEAKEEAKEKDRESVRKYRHRAALAGFRIVLA